MAVTDQPRITDEAHEAITRPVLPLRTPAAARVKRYMEKVPGRKVVLATNMALEVARRHRRTQLSAPRFRRASACTRVASVNADATAKQLLSPKKTAIFDAVVPNAAPLSRARGFTNTKWMIMYRYDRSANSGLESEERGESVRS